MQNTTSHHLNAIQQRSTYFQTQEEGNLLCGLHAVNNLLGEHAYEEQDFENICEQLEKQQQNISESKQAHRHCCPCVSGDYDANIIFIALQNKGFQVEWLDKMKPIESSPKIAALLATQRQPSNKNVQVSQIVGFLVNIRRNASCLKQILGRLFCTSSRHWCCIRKLNKQYILLDSLFDEPLKFQSLKQAVSFLALQLTGNAAEVMLVTRKQKTKPKSQISNRGL